MVLAGLCAAPAVAQKAPSVSEPGIDDIVVTAQHREEPSQSVPIAMDALPAARLEREAIANLDRIGAAVPNLYLARNFGTSSGALVFMRGVGEGDSIFTNDPPVGCLLYTSPSPRDRG